MFAAIRPEWDFIDARHAGIAAGRELERRLPDLVTTNWWKEERGSAVFVDYNQMARDRTIASAWSVRALAAPTVSVPVTWDELGDVEPDEFTIATAPAVLAARGDAWATLGDNPGGLAALLEMWDRDVAAGRGEMPYPPDYPKMPGEPPRVQPSRKRSSDSR